MLRRITSFSTTHRRTVYAIWVVVVVAAAVVTPSLFGRLITDAGDLDGTESQRAEEALWRAAPSGDSIFAVAAGVAATDPALRQSVIQTAQQLQARAGIAEVRTPWSADPAHAAPEAVASDGRAIAIEVVFTPTDAGEEAVDDAANLLRSIDAPRVLVGGGPLLDDEMSEQAASDLARAELLTTPILIVLLLLIFGSVVAAGLPLLITFVAAAATLGTLFAFSLASDVSVYAVNIVTMLGLGLAIDYALLIVARYREERSGGLDTAAALDTTMGTAGRTVVFSGLTVAASLAGLLVFPDDFLRSMGFAGLAVVLLDMVAAVTLLPALLASIGHRIKPATARPASGGVLGAIARLVCARPVVPLLVVAGVLLLAAVPFAGARFADPDERSLPTSSESRQLAEVAHARFTDMSTTDPITIVGPASWGTTDLESYIARIGGLDGVGAIDVRDHVPSLTVVDVAPQGDSQGTRALELVSDIRALDTSVAVDVTGDAAELVDYEHALLSRIPWALGLVAVATFVLLFLFTGSVVIPVQSLVMSVLSLGASFGALVWVFQDGHLGSVVGTEALGSLSMSTPTLVFAIAFGLSMDYEVFLLGRMTEVWRQTGDVNRAIVTGIERTGRIVTAAATLMVVVYAGFVTGGFSPVKQVGLGLVIAVAVDATVVRLVLLPAVMTLLGKANWWAPAPLRRLHDRIGLTETVRSPQGDRTAAPASPAESDSPQALAGTGTSPR